MNEATGKYVYNGNGDTLLPLYVVKVGGNVIDDEDALQTFLKNFSLLNERKILVHGGGKIATAIGDKLGIKSEYKDGRRITNDETIDLVTMVYGGLVNKKIVAILQSLQCNAIGLTGADANVMPAVKRPVGDVDYGWAGDITQRNVPAKQWQFFLENFLVPVLAPLTHDFQGHLLNTNADTMASAVSVALSRFYKVSLIYCFEKAGVLENLEDEQSVIKKIDRKIYDQLKEDKKIHSGILPKIDNAFASVDAGVSRVIIGKATEIELLINQNGGTTITN